MPDEKRDKTKRQRTASPEEERKAKEGAAAAAQALLDRLSGSFPKPGDTEPGSKERKRVNKFYKSGQLGVDVPVKVFGQPVMIRGKEAKVPAYLPATVGAKDAVATYALIFKNMVVDARTDYRIFEGLHQEAKIQRYFSEHFTPDKVAWVVSQVTWRDEGFGVVAYPTGDWKTYTKEPHFLPNDSNVRILEVWGGNWTPEYKARVRAHLEKSSHAWETVQGAIEFLKAGAQAAAIGVPLTEKEVEQLNRAIEEIKKGDAKVSEAGDGAKEDPAKVALAPEEETAVRTDLAPPLLDLPVAPPAGGEPGAPPVSVAGTGGPAEVEGEAGVEGSRRSFSSSGTRQHSEEDGGAATESPPNHAGNLIQEYEHGIRRMLLETERMIEDFLSSRPPVPPWPGPSRPQTSGWGVVLDDVRKLAGKEPEEAFSGEGPAGVFAALMKAVPELRAPHKIKGAGDDDERAWLAMYAGGRWRASAETPKPGDLAFVANPMVKGGTYAAVVLEAAGKYLIEGLALYPGDDRYRLARDAVVPGGAPRGEIFKAWHPAPYRTLDPESGMGRFWGPDMRRMLKLISNHLFSFGSTLGDFVADLTDGTPYEARSFEGLVEKAGRELYRIDGTTPLWTGCVLFTSRDDELGVVLSDGSILGFGRKARLGNHRMGWQKLGPEYVWYPQLAGTLAVKPARPAPEAL